MSLAQQLNQTTAMTPSDRERKKTAQQKAEDVIYTLNHTFTCLSITDFAIMPIIYGLTGGRWGHKHTHAHGNHDGHDHGASATKPVAAGPVAHESNDVLKARLDKVLAEKKDKPGKKGAFQKLLTEEAQSGLNEEKHLSETLRSKKKTGFLARVGHWFAGEFVGDVGAAFVTIGAQRFAPGLMASIRNALEPTVGGFFRRGAERSSKKWADKHGLAHDNAEVVARAERLYEYEMAHLPQMAMWTGSSIVLHYITMRLLEPISLRQFATQKALGAGITAGIVLGARAFAPDKAHGWDETLGKHVVLPLTKATGKLFGIEEKDVEEYHAKRREMDGDEAPSSKTSKVERQGTVAARVKEHASDAAASHASRVQQSLDAPLTAARA